MRRAAHSGGGVQKAGAAGGWRGVHRSLCASPCASHHATPPWSLAEARFLNPSAAQARPAPMVVSERGPVQQEAEAGFAALTEGGQSGSHHPPPPADGSLGGEPPSPPAPLASNGEEGSEAGSPKLHPSDSKQSSFAPASSAGSDTGSGTGAASGGSGPEITHYDSRWAGGLHGLYAVTSSCVVSGTWDEGKQRRGPPVQHLLHGSAPRPLLATHHLPLPLLLASCPRPLAARMWCCAWSSSAPQRSRQGFCAAVQEGRCGWGALTRLPRLAAARRACCLATVEHTKHVAQGILCR